jgi:hypothetical protein
MLLFLVIILYLSSAGIMPAEISAFPHMEKAPAAASAISVVDDASDLASFGEIPPAANKHRRINLPPARRVPKDAWQFETFTSLDTPSGKYCEGTLSGASLAAYPT